MKTLSLLFVCLALSLGCDDGEDDSAPSSANCIRTGAVCNDGTTSTATGSGACSHHGGVKNWVCK